MVTYSKAKQKTLSYEYYTDGAVVSIVVSQ